MSFCLEPDLPQLTTLTCFFFLEISKPSQYLWGSHGDHMATAAEFPRLFRTYCFVVFCKPALQVLVILLLKRVLRNRLRAALPLTRLRRQPLPCSQSNTLDF